MSGVWRDRTNLYVQCMREDLLTSSSSQRWKFAADMGHSPDISHIVSHMRIILLRSERLSALPPMASPPLVMNLKNVAGLCPQGLSKMMEMR